MRVSAKICGIRTETALEAAVAGGAAHVGFVFYPPSPRSVSVDEAARLARATPDSVGRVALVVDPDDAVLDEIAGGVELEMLQLHGGETASRVAEIRRRTGLRVMKAVKVAAAADVDTARDYEEVADVILFDAKAPKDRQGALPGGNALSFDWQLLAGRQWQRPWMLSGGLTADNVADAVRISGATAVDVSSGVESAPGEKDPAKIAAFLAAVSAL